MAFSATHYVQSGLGLLATLASVTKLEGNVVTIQFTIPHVVVGLVTVGLTVAGILGHSARPSTNEKAVAKNDAKVAADAIVKAATPS
jgi:hypothetical protein